jgi:Fe-S-cluster-containing hydrogenase component 2
VSLLSAAERLAAIDRSQVVFNADRCLHTKDKFSECTSCFEICPAGAIVAGKPPELNSEKCDTCLACLPVCPTGAFSADDDVTPLLTAASHVEGGTLEIICGLHSSPDHGVSESYTGLRIHQCLAGLGTGAYAELAALGFEHVVLRCEVCHSCKWSSLHREIEKHTQRANHFLSGWGMPAFVQIVDELVDPVERPMWNADSPAVSRRELFKLIVNRSQTVMARAMENVSPNNARTPGKDRLRLLSASQHLPIGRRTGAPNLDGLLFASINIKENCSACAACANACPTDALSFSKSIEGKQFSIRFDAKRCIDCGICMHVCGVSAIEIQPGSSNENIFSDEVVVLMEGKLTNCDHCGAAMVEQAEIKLCPVCEYRTKRSLDQTLPKVVQMAIEARAKCELQ